MTFQPRAGYHLADQSHRRLLFVAHPRIRARSVHAHSGTPGAFRCGRLREPERSSRLAEQLLGETGRHAVRQPSQALEVDRDLLPVDLEMCAFMLATSTILGVGLISGEQIRWIEAERRVEGPGMPAGQPSASATSSRISSVLSSRSPPGRRLQHGPRSAYWRVPSLGAVAAVLPAPGAKPQLGVSHYLVEAAEVAVLRLVTSAWQLLASRSVLAPCPASHVPTSRARRFSGGSA